MRSTYGTVGGRPRGGEGGYDEVATVEATDVQEAS